MGWAPTASSMGAPPRDYPPYHQPSGELRKGWLEGDLELGRSMTRVRNPSLPASWW